MASAIPLEMYNVRLGLNWSLDRVLLGLLMIMLPLYWARIGSLPLFPLILALLGWFATTISVASGAGLDSFALNIIPSIFQGYALFAVSVVVFANNPKAVKLAVIIGLVWFFIFSFFAVWMLYFYYVVGARVVPLPFAGYVFDFDPHKLDQFSSQRLFMPFASAPHLGSVCGFLAIFFFVIYLYSRRLPSILLCISFVGIAFLTLSRGPFLAIAICFGLLVILGGTFKVVRLDKRIFAIFFVALSAVVGLEGYKAFQQEQTGRATAERLQIDVEEIKYGRHLALRLYAFELFAESNVAQVVFGQGFGAFLKTGVGAYSFASYLTLMVESGLFGMAVFLTVLLYPIFKGWLAFQSTGRAQPLYFFAFTLGCYLFLSHSFYELKSLGVLWVMSAQVWGMCLSKSSELVSAGEWIMQRR